MLFLSCCAFLHCFHNVMSFCYLSFMSFSSCYTCFVFNVVFVLLPCFHSVRSFTLFSSCFVTSFWSCYACNGYHVFVLLHLLRCFWPVMSCYVLLCCFCHVMSFLSHIFYIILILLILLRCVILLLTAESVVNQWGKSSQKKWSRAYSDVSMNTNLNSCIF